MRDVLRVSVAEDADGVWILLCMEYLDHADGWRHPFEVVWDSSKHEVLEAKNAVRNALEHAHTLPLEGEGVTTVHGDCRGPNILMRQDDSVSGKT